ncbi:MAG: hypothetical protein A2V88_13725 [Elusimicrobia bacterium RBG_16_66_12]|nr:MAG: hypothetical protein A2V88_13725 [Elusimicrobia bacterium RBG_16_66_12]
MVRFSAPRKRVQGWRKHKIYPDFVFTESNTHDGASHLYILETKGAHLKNDDAGGRAASHLINEEE